MQRALPVALISNGVVTRKYSLHGGEPACVAYHTPSQSVVFLEGDSAEVWWRIYEAQGDCDAAFDYICRNGAFVENRESEARAVLGEFLDGLESSNLIGQKSYENRRDPAVAAAMSVKQGVDPTQNPELEIGQFMADRHVLYSLVLELTYRCNERCVHCYLPSDTRPSELSALQIDHLLGEFSNMGGLLLQLTGGELLIRKDIVEILDISKTHGFVTSITSNLTLLNDSILKAIVEVQPRSVGCSIYAATAEMHDAVTTIKGSFERSVRSIRLLRSAGIPVIIKSPLLRSTAPHWRDIERLAQDLDCEYQFDLSITAKNDGGLSPLSNRVEDMSVLQDIFASRYYKLYTRDEAMFTLTSPSPEASLCGAGASGLCISPDGTVRPCIGLNLSLGRWPQNKLSEIWQSSSFFSEFGAIRLREIPECHECPDFAYCSRCPGAWHAEHGSFRKPTTYACKLAHAWAETQRREHASRKGDQFSETDRQS
jgi:radical SAM protein with 4Fe4S-binding SPASM domain